MLGDTCRLGMRVWIHQDCLPLITGLNCVRGRIAAFIGSIVVRFYFLELRLLVLEVVLDVLVSRVVVAVGVVLLFGVLLPMHARISR